MLTNLALRDRSRALICLRYALFAQCIHEEMRGNIMKWTGVMPALTTAFDADLKIDCDFVARHALWQIENGVTGLVVLGSLGEAATLSFDEKIALIETLVKAVDGKVPVVAAISALSTRRSRSPGANGPGAWRRRTDDSAALCLQRRLAGNESACGRNAQGDAAARPCCTTTPSRTEPISRPSRFMSWQRNFTTCRR